MISQIKMQKLTTCNQLTSQIDKMATQFAKYQKNIKRLVAFVGSTGSGKSSLGCYLRNAPLTYKKAKGGGKYIIDHDDTTGKYPIIGHERQSCTTHPEFYKQNNQAFVDLPGWFDMRTENQQILNGISNSMIFTAGKEIKIVIVVEESEFKPQRGGVLIEIINRLMSFFALDSPTIINSIILVISKVKIQDYDDLQSFYQYLLQYSLQNPKTSQNSSYLLKTLVQTKRIFLFPIPTDIKNHIQVIRKQISNIKPTKLNHNGCITYQRFTVYYAELLNHLILQTFQQCRVSIQTLLKESLKISNIKIIFQLCEQLNELNQYFPKLKKAVDSIQRANLIKNFANRLILSQQEQKLKKLELITFLASILDKSQVKVNLNLLRLPTLENLFNQYIHQVQYIKRKLVIQKQSQKQMSKFKRKQQTLRRQFMEEQKREYQTFIRQFKEKKFFLLNMYLDN